jgi:hypothetical protein
VQTSRLGHRPGRALLNANVTIDAFLIVHFGMFLGAVADLLDAVVGAHIGTFQTGVALLNVNLGWHGTLQNKGLIIPLFYRFGGRFQFNS